MRFITIPVTSSPFIIHKSFKNIPTISNIISLLQTVNIPQDVKTIELKIKFSNIV